MTTNSKRKPLDSSERLRLAHLTWEQQLRVWRNDPCAYAEERLGLTLWPKFREILTSVRDNPQTAVQSANGIGKSTAIAIIVLWWLDTREQAIVLTSAARHQVLSNVLWPRIHSLNQQAQVFPGAQMLDLAIKLGPERYAYAKSSDTAEGVAGAHSPNMLVVVDEASGIEPKLSEGLDGNVIGENDRIIWVGNPLEPSGVFYEKCHNKAIHRIQISALEHPNVVSGENLIPGAVSRRKTLLNCQEWGKEVEPGTPGAIELPWCNRWFILDQRGMPRILGQFPEAGAFSLITRAAIEQAKTRTPVKATRYVLGIDPAGGEVSGDETAFALCTQHSTVGTEGRSGMKPDEIAGRAKQIVQEYGVDTIVVDCSGGYGGGVVSYLKRELPGVEIIPVSFGESATDKNRWANRKAEIYWHYGEQVKNNPYYSISPDPVFEKQATEARLSPNFRGQDMAESKDEYAKRNNNESPDRFEAACLANWGATQRVNKAAVSNRYIAQENKIITMEQT